MNRFSKGKIEVCAQQYGDGFWVHYVNSNGKIGWHTETLKNKSYAFKLAKYWANVIGCKCYDINGNLLNKK